MRYDREDGAGAQTAGQCCATGAGVFRLTDLLDCLGRWARGAQFSHGLNPAQWESLRFLNRANLPSRTPGALARYLGTTRGTASQTVRALEKKGLLCRQPDRHDRRIVYLRLTERGAELLRQDPLLQLDRTLMSRIDAPTAATINDNLSQVLACFQSAALGQTFGTCERCGHHRDTSDAGRSHCRLIKFDLRPEDALGLCVNFMPREVQPATDL